MWSAKCYNCRIEVSNLESDDYFCPSCHRIFAERTGPPEIKAKCARKVIPPPLEISADYCEFCGQTDRDYTAVRIGRVHLAICGTCRDKIKVTRLPRYVSMTIVTGGEVSK